MIRSNPNLGRVVWLAPLDLAALDAPTVPLDYYHETIRDERRSGLRCSYPRCPVFVSDLVLLGFNGDAHVVWGAAHTQWLAKVQHAQREGLVEMDEALTSAVAERHTKSDVDEIAWLRRRVEEIRVPVGRRKVA